MTNYLNIFELNNVWLGYQASGDSGNWSHLSIMVYSICSGIICNKFKYTGLPSYECADLIQDTFCVLMSKIKTGRMTYNPELGKPFNLLTKSAINSALNELDKHIRPENNLNKMISSLKEIYKNKGYGE